MLFSSDSNFFGIVSQVENVGFECRIIAVTSLDSTGWNARTGKPCPQVWLEYKVTTLVGCFALTVQSWERVNKVIRIKICSALTKCNYEEICISINGCMLLHRTLDILTRLSLIFCGRSPICMKTLLIHEWVATGKLCHVAARLICNWFIFCCQLFCE